MEIVIGFRWEGGEKSRLFILMRPEDASVLKSGGPCCSTCWFLLRVDMLIWTSPEGNMTFSLRKKGSGEGLTMTIPLSGSGEPARRLNFVLSHCRPCFILFMIVVLYCRTFCVALEGIYDVCWPLKKLKPRSATTVRG